MAFFFSFFFRFFFLVFVIEIEVRTEIEMVCTHDTGVNHTMVRFRTIPLIAVLYPTGVTLL